MAPPPLDTRPARRLVLDHGAWFLAAEVEDALDDHLEATAARYEDDELQHWWKAALVWLDLPQDLEPTRRAERLWAELHPPDEDEEADDAD